MDSWFLWGPALDFFDSDADVCPGAVCWGIACQAHSAKIQQGQESSIGGRFLRFGLRPCSSSFGRRMLLKLPCLFRWTLSSVSEYIQHILRCAACCGAPFLCVASRLNFHVRAWRSVGWLTSNEPDVAEHKFQALFIYLPPSGFSILCSASQVTERRVSSHKVLGFGNSELLVHHDDRLDDGMGCVCTRSFPLERKFPASLLTEYMLSLAQHRILTIQDRFLCFSLINVNQYKQQFQRVYGAPD